MSRMSSTRNRGSSKRTEAGYWLLKSEPNVYSIDDLNAAEGRRTTWHGVRN
jgi:hypothetical protein